jgi:F0F1-type ATP synthase membrane subunit b/b'
LIVQVIFVQIVFFFGLVFVLRKILLASSYNETKRLQQLNEENAQKAQELAAKISEADNEYREKMLRTDEEIELMKEKARKEIQDLKEVVIAKAKAEGDRLMTQALNARDEIRAEIEEQVQERVVEFSQKVFSQILSAPEQKLLHEGLLKHVLEEMNAVESERLKAVCADKTSGDVVQVKVSHGLTAQQKKEVENILSSKLGRTITVEESVNSEIIAGIVISLGSFVIDGSLLSRFKKAAEKIK